MAKIIDRTGKGASISQGEFDGNYDSLHGVNQAISGASHTVDITDQGDTLEFTSGGAVAVTLDSIATILTAAHTSDFHVTIFSSGTGTVVTITPDALNTINTGVSTIVLTENEYVTFETDSTGLTWNIICSSDALNLGGLSSSQFLRSDANDTATGDLTFSGDNSYTGQSDFDLNGIEIASVPVTTTAAELNLLDGATVTTAEINNIDGGTPASAITAVGADRVVYNDDGSMIQVALTTLSAYFRSVAETLTNKILTSPVINTGVSGSAVDTDPTLAANSDTLLVSQKAIKAFVGLNTKIIDIGDWDMDADLATSVLHGVTQSKIRCIKVLIRHDAGIILQDYHVGNNLVQAGAAGDNIYLQREAAGIFDSTAYDSIGFNRGWITIRYTD